ncbi:hypothetical protein EW146_g10318 [Bondarzewia mesenterica]|uniref:Queuosine 5'-phosphate N-glycosylase/hydrolase n=1 Tax=Bondarzewia mesenterica TaxID=1095465 RepID=A0A4S4KYK9_9AGAM|nr:hypothetical protein EW146_g10318 [Bondarzewia mesenterica]
MFADYRVPQILHHLRILTYPPHFTHLLHTHAMVPHGTREEVSVRAASVVAVDRVRAEIVGLRLAERQKGNDGEGRKEAEGEEVSSVLIDFYLWDLAKRIENGEERVAGIQTEEMLPAHRTRSIWY